MCAICSVAVLRDWVGPSTHGSRFPNSKVDHNRKPLDSDRNPRNSTLPLRYDCEIICVWISVSCARAVLSGTMAVSVLMSRSQTTLKIKHNSEVFWSATYTTVNVVESIRETGYLNEKTSKKKDSPQFYPFQQLHYTSFK